jgi:plastocyanin
MLLRAGEIQGEVVVTRRLTRPKVTAPAETYRRGLLVELEAEPDVDWLAFERAHVAVYLEGNFPPSQTLPVAVIEQRGRRFVPDFVVIPAGSSVSFPNLDPIFHNVFSLSKPRSFDLGNYPRNQTRLVDFPKPGIVTVGCHLHPNMGATIVVTPNRWAAVPGGDGRFTLRDIPAGRHMLVAWHRSTGPIRRQLDVPAQGSISVRLEIPVSAEESRALVAGNGGKGR